MFLTIGEKILVPIIVAVILAILAFAWKGFTNGKFIEALGGVSKTQLEEHKHDSLGLKDAVIAFDIREGCPEGWSEFYDAESRTIIGAAFDKSSNLKLAPRPFRADDEGKEYITLTKDNIPGHTHAFKDIYYSEDVELESKKDYEQKTQDVIETMAVPGELGSSGTDKDNIGWIMQHETESFGKGTKFTNMPPYIALFYCRRD